MTTMSIRFTEDEREMLGALAAVQGISLNEAVRKAVRDTHTASAHRERVLTVGRSVIDSDSELLDRLG